MSDGKRIYLDSDVYLALFKGEEGRCEIAANLLRGGQDKHFVVVASTRVYAEVCGHGEVKAARNHQKADAKIDSFFEGGFIRWVEVDLVLARHARRLSRQYGLRGADAIHLASAIRASCDRLMTWDKKFPAGCVVEGVSVERPRLLGQLQVDDLKKPHNWVSVGQDDRVGADGRSDAY